MFELGIGAADQISLAVQLFPSLRLWRRVIEISSVTQENLGEGPNVSGNVGIFVPLSPAHRRAARKCRRALDIIAPSD